MARMLNAILRDAQIRASALAPIVTADELSAALRDARYTGPVLVHFKDGRPVVYAFHPTLTVKVK